MNDAQPAHSVARSTWALVVAVALGCSSRTQSASGGRDGGAIPVQQDAASVLERVPEPLPDVIVDPRDLPAGAVAQIGRPRFVGGDALRTLSVREDGSVFGHGHQYARLWDGNSGEVRWGMRGNDRGLFAAAASSADVVVAIRGGNIHSELEVVDVRRGAVLFKRQYGDVYAVAISPDGRFVLLMGSTLSLIDVAARDDVATPRAVAANAGIIRDDRSALVLMGDSILRWDGTRNSTPEVIATLPTRARIAAFARDGSRVAWANGDRFGVVDLTSAASVMEVNKKGLSVATIAISDDGARVATGSAGKLAVWDVGATEPAWERSSRYKSQPPAAFRRDGEVLVGEVSTVARLGPDGAARPSVPITRFRAFAANGTLILDVDGRTTGLDLGTKQESPPGPWSGEPVPSGAPDWVDEAEVAFDGSVIGWNDEEGDECAPVRIWRSKGDVWKSGKPRDCDATTRVGPWVFAPGMLADATSSSPVVFDTSSGKVVLEIPGAGRELIDLVGSPDLDIVVAVFERRPISSLDRDVAEDEVEEPGYGIEVWSRKTGKMLARATVPLDRGGLYDAIVTRDGMTAYLGWGDGSVDAVSLPTAEVRTVGQHPAGVRVVHESPTSKHIATLDDDGRTLVWPR